MRQIKIFDTTLREGEKTQGVHFNIYERLLIAKSLQNLGVDVIEAGGPMSSQLDFLSVSTISKEVKDSMISAFCRADKKEISLAYEAIKNAQSPRIHTFISTSTVNYVNRDNMTEEEILNNSIEMVKYAASLCDDVEFSAEDAYRSNPKFLVRLFKEVIKSGAKTINIPDTAGGALPEDYFKLVKYIIDNTQGIENAAVSVHCHNDLGFAVANALNGVLAGAAQVECTLNGVGDRAGNASLQEIVSDIEDMSDRFGLYTGVRKKEILKASELVSSLTGIFPN